ncbi:YihY/virulence factor BrkB family protein [Hyphobacterium sp. HN65]|uniref:YihY/virulence factor BrkB family protein n=1 Tax=Hyphobacterium lacteum TaxID=3116575 RepID=A0ABU7LM26_9PROT|nr:YihY/virulence factor BrkB family protein [Hyphobacterium sp. HN65]MEE2524976.1 YihY/virulence factor BrkB family protein [Hyphobacterium sp. HN65]
MSLARSLSQPARRLPNPRCASLHPQAGAFVLHGCFSGYAVNMEILRSHIRRVHALVRPVLTWPPLAILIAAVSRTMAREVMLFAGGVSFFTLLAIFPLVAAGVAIYGLLFDVNDAAQQVGRLSTVLPDSARAFAESQISPIAEASRASLSVQGLIALAISLFAASRGAKALIAGLNQIGGVGDLRNIFKFNVYAIFTVLIGGALLFISNVIVLTIPTIVRPAAEFLGIEITGLNSFFNEWTAVALTMITALALLYRYLMRHAGGITWAASIIAAATATLLWLLLSAGFSIYTASWVRPTAYGSIGALIVFLLWIYWGSYAVFFGGAVAVEVDRRQKAVMHRRG